MLKSRWVWRMTVGVVTAILFCLTMVALAVPHQLALFVGLGNPRGQASIPASMGVYDSAQELDSARDDTKVNKLADPKLLSAAAPKKAEHQINRQQLSARLSKVDRSKVVTAGNRVVIGYAVIDIDSGAVLAQDHADDLLIPASNTKVLTAAAVFNVFQGSERFTTSVVSNSADEIVLVGNGDGLLTVEPLSKKAYPQRSSLRDLASQTATALRWRGISSVRLGYDDSYFSGAGWAPTWSQEYITEVSPISALWADFGKVNGQRQADPSKVAAVEFGNQLQQMGIQVTQPKPMRAKGERLAAIRSAPISAFVDFALQHSDNSTTEILGMQLAKKLGRATTFSNSAESVMEQMAQLGLWQQSFHLDDTSGLSRSNHFSALMLAQLHAKAAHSAKISQYFSGLPVAGSTGSLRFRFADSLSRAGRGLVHAKTGTLTGVTSLSGTLRTKDGNHLAFAVIVNGDFEQGYGKVFEDHFVGAMADCGCR